MTCFDIFYCYHYFLLFTAPVLFLVLAAPSLPHRLPLIAPAARRSGPPKPGLHVAVVMYLCIYMESILHFHILVRRKYKIQCLEWEVSGNCNRRTKLCSLVCWIASHQHSSSPTLALTHFHSVLYITLHRGPHVIDVVVVVFIVYYSLLTLKKTSIFAF